MLRMKIIAVLGSQLASLGQASSANCGIERGLQLTSGAMYLVS